MKTLPEVGDEIDFEYGLMASYGPYFGEATVIEVSKLNHRNEETEEVHARFKLGGHIHCYPVSEMKYLNNNLWAIIERSYRTLNLYNQFG